MIGQLERQRLLDVARRSLEARVRGEPAPEVPADLNRPAAGLFVTIHCRGELRGCLGTLDDSSRLGEAVVRLSADVTHEDYRFRPLTAGELPEVLIDLSVLTPAEVVGDPTEIEVGRDGLIVEQGSRRGLLLPQVAPEHGWDREAFLGHTCIKAGLRSDAWRRGATIRRFQAEVFGDTETPK